MLLTVSMSMITTAGASDDIITLFGSTQEPENDLLSSFFGNSDFIVPNASQYFKESQQSGTGKVSDLVSGPYDVYGNVAPGAVDAYIERIKALGYTASDSLLDNGVKQWVISKPETALVLLYGEAQQRVVICYQEGVPFVEEGASEAPATVFLPSFSTIAPTPSATAAPWESAPGFINVTIDGTKRTLYQTKSKKSYVDIYESVLMYTFCFEGYNEWGDVDARLEFSVWSKVISGDVFTNKTDGPNVIKTDNLRRGEYEAVIYYDRFSNQYYAGIVPGVFVGEWRNNPYKDAAYTIRVDTISKDRLSIAGNLSAKVYKGSDLIQIENGMFQAKMHSGNEEEYIWVEKQ